MFKKKTLGVPPEEVELSSLSGDEKGSVSSESNEFTRQIKRNRKLSIIGQQSTLAPWQVGMLSEDKEAQKAITCIIEDVQETFERVIESEGPSIAEQVKVVEDWWSQLADREFLRSK